ncbi:hypothetical protein [Brevundimonas sp.]|uniref:tetratricopeptide repeat protein n=1 Tax=Brevundimonas sp. TaxID=1871086 RepID=UPI002737B9E0|nr:hypothetical protein [Brevundimonas sp.]MDP3801269.1 hypothetical protein [Brevundimonas sp.]
MRLSRLALLLTGCALTALASASPTSSARAQDAPVVVPAPDETVPAPAGPAIILEGEPGVMVEGGPVESAPPFAVAIPPVWSPVPRDAEGQSAYGLYLSGRLASIRGDRATGAELLAEAQVLTPEQPMIVEEAFKSGLFSGDLDAVARLTPMVEGMPDLVDAGRMVDLVQTLRAGDAAASLAMMTARPLAPPFDLAGRYLTPTIAGAAGDWDRALQAVDVPATDPAGLILRQQRASLLESRRRFDEAEAEYRTLTATPGGSLLYAMDFAEFLERRGRRDEALAIYDAALTGDNPDSAAVLARARVTARGRPPAAPDHLERAADALEFAAMQTSAGELHDYAAIYRRLAYSLHPSDESALRLGQSFTAGRRPQPESAREAFGRVSQADPITYARAQIGLARTFTGEEDAARALEALRRADAAAAGQPAFAFELAAGLEDMELHEEALEILNRPTMNVPGQPVEFRFLRGAALEGLGRLVEAENELWAALQARPEDPGILNYLGYMWVDSGRRVEQGAEMLARAHAASPEDGSIQDSLGWAQFRQGQYEAAVENLEGAVNKLPANPTIVDHLGDAYWQIGRRREAEWQWNRVLTLEPDAERRAEVERKLARGLSTVPSVSPDQL